MKKIRSFVNYITEEIYDPNSIEPDDPILVDNIKQIELSNKLKELLNKAKTIVCEYNSGNCNISDSDDAIELLSDIEEEHELYNDADKLISEIIELVDEIELKNNN